MDAFNRWATKLLPLSSLPGLPVKFSATRIVAPQQSWFDFGQTSIGYSMFAQKLYY